MAHAYDELLDEVVAARRKRGGAMQPPATPAALRLLREKARAQLFSDVPQEYADFLGKVNGLNHNGLVIYATETTPIVGYNDRFIDGFVEANLDWREDEAHEDLLFFADGNISVYVYNLIDGAYQMLDRSSNDLCASFESFDAMIAEALKEHL